MTPVEAVAWFLVGCAFGAAFQVSVRILQAAGEL